MAYYAPSVSSQDDYLHQSVEEPSSVLYFAYGSNLNLAQMAQRCPDSLFIGKATLHGYRWQINERGVANVIPSDEYVTQGLIYIITPEDEAELDRFEGVAKGLYQKHFLTVALEPHDHYCNLKSSRIARMLSNEPAPTDRDTNGSESSGSTRQDAWVPIGVHEQGQGPQYRRQEAKALVYVSENYTTDGAIREEYIFRIHKAVLDAVAFGMSRQYAKTYIFPHLDHGDDLGEAMGRFLAQVRPINSKRAIEMAP